MTGGGEGGVRPPAPPAAAWLSLLSLPLLVLLWQGAAMGIGSRFLPTPIAVAAEALRLTLDGALLADFGKTLVRAAAGFVLAMALGTALGLVLGRLRWADRLFGPWVTIGLNLPAIVVAILLYIWLGLTDLALILAVVVNKLPLVATTIRAGSRALRPEFDELARAFRLPFARRLRHIWLPQLLPHLLNAARTGLALIWKMVLVFEVLGSDGGVGFRIGIFFQYFDMAGILAYATVFVALVLLAEYGLLAPLERRAARWRQDLG